MILARYIAREILSTTFAITLVLMIVVMSGRLSSYIADAATGKLASGLVFPVLLARLPEYLELVLPLSLFLGVLISLMQLRQSSELTVMTATGLGSSSLLKVIVLCATFVALVVASFSFYVSPRGGQYVNSLLASQGFQDELSVVTPGRFYQIGAAGGTLYAAEISEDRSVMSGVMLSRVGIGEAGERQAVVLAESGYPQWSDNGGYYFVLEQGKRFEGTPGAADFRVTEFERYHQLLLSPKPVEGKRTDEQISFLHQLIGNDSAAAVAELHWRLSMPLLVMILAVIALPLSETAPREGGRFSRVLPGVLLYMFYLVALNAVREEVTDGNTDAAIKFWIVHSVFLALALYLMFKDKLVLPRKTSGALS